MEFKVLGKPIYHFKLSVKQVEVLTKCSQLHYDAACTSAGLHGGFIYAWKNLADAMTDKDEVLHKADFRDIDTSLKILETSWLLEDETDQATALELKQSFRNILLRSDLYSNWCVESVIV